MASATGSQHGKYKAFALEEGIDIVYPDLDDPVASKAPVKYEIVAIPGIGANEEWTWKQSKTHWLKDPNMLGKRIEGARISIFQFQSNWFGKGSVNQRFDNIANQLLYGLDRTRRKTDSKTPIIFICHSLGGIILLKALLTSRLRQANFPYIFPYVAGAIFLGTPFNGTNEVQGLVLGEHASSIGMGAPESLIKFLEKDSEALRELVYDFSILASSAHMRLFCFFEQVETDLKEVIIKGVSLGDRQIFKDISSTRQDIIVDSASATLTSFEKLGLQTSHFFLNKFDGSKNSSFRYVSEEIVTTVQEAPRILKSRQNALRQRLVDDQTCQIMRDYLGSGFSQVKIAIKGSNRQQRSSKAVTEMEAFQTWKDSTTAKLLWVHGEAATGRQEAVASSAIEFLEASRASGHIVASFYCHQSEKQRRSLLGLLQLVVRQVIDANQDLAVHLLSDTSMKETGKPAFDADTILKERVLWDALLSMASDLGGESIYVIVYGIEQLSEDSLPQFLALIKEFSDLTAKPAGPSSTPALKWLLLSRSGRPQITKALKSRAAEINLEDGENIARFSADLRNEISLRVNDINLPSSLAYFVKRHLHSRAEGNWIYVSLVGQEVRNAWVPGTTHANIRELLESFPYGLTDMFEHVRRRVLDPAAEKHEYIKEILRCRICAYVAPTMLELAIMAGVPKEDRDDPDILKDYIIRCGGFFTIDYNDRVEWIHPSAQDHLEEYARDILGLDLLDMQHGIIALRSLEYIHELVEEAGSNGNGNEQDQDEEQDDDEHQDDEDSGTHSRDNATDAASAKTSTVDDNDAGGSRAGEEDDEDEDSENMFDDTPDYPIRHWVEHAKRADTDVLNEFDFSHAFWQAESVTREQWWKAINDVHGLYEQTKVSTLHIAVILKFPALVNYLLERDWKNDVEQTDSEGFQPLYYACKNGDEDIVNALLGAGADIGHTDDDDKPTALHAAASFGHLDIVKILLERGADLNSSSKSHGTALYAAIANHNNDIAKFMLSEGAQANTIGGSSKRAINIAALSGNIEGVQLLLDHGVEIDPDDEDYWYGSALGAAARNGHTDIVKLLLSKGWTLNRGMKTYGSFLTAAATYNHLEIFEIFLKDEERITVLEQALQAAAQRGYAPIVQAVLAKTLTTTYSIRHQKAFALAAFYGRVEVLKLLFDKDITQEQLDNALYQATDNEHEETVKLLLDQGASPDAEGPVYGFALAASAFDGTKGILEALIAKGADVNKRKPDSDYGTALQAAAYCGNAENVRLLISHGAVLNTEPIGIYGNELQAAVYTGDTNTIELLLSHHANVNAQGGLYTYSIIAAVSRGFSSATKILLDHGAHVNVKGGADNWPVICLAASTLRREDLKPILKYVYDINATCDKGTTALINCADACDTEGLKLLIEQHRANVSIISGSHGTALHAAAAQGDEDSCRVLLEAGAFVNSVGGPYGTALQAAAWADDIECVRELLGANADPNILGGEYGTALLAACENGSLEVVSELLSAGATINVHPAHDRYGSALTAASASGNLELVSLLLERGADVNLEGGHHGFPLLAASWSANKSIVDLLLEHGANPLVGGHTWGSAIIAAAYGNGLEIIETLIEHDVDVHAEGGKYSNSLQTAAMKADIEVIDYILDRAIDLVNVQGGKYHTPLIAAAYFDRLEVVDKLLNASADFRIRGGQYKSAVTAAAIRGNRAVLEKFLKMGPPGIVLDEALVAAIAHRQTASVDMLFKAGADVKTRQADLGSPHSALQAPQMQDENSDIEEDDLEEDEEDDDENESADDEWEGDSGSTSGDTDDGSVTDLQLEDEVTEEDKIQRLLDDAMARCKRNPTIKRFRTVKHGNLPKTRSFGVSLPPTIPAMPALPAAFAAHTTASDSAPQFVQPVWTPSAANSQIMGQQGMHQYYAEPKTISTSALPSPLIRRKQLPAGHTTPQSQESQDSHSGQYPFPTEPQQRPHSNSTASMPNAPRASTPPSRNGSIDTGLKRSKNAMNRRSMISLNPGAAGRYQGRQPSTASQSSLDHPIAELDFAEGRQQTPPLSLDPSGPYCTYPVAQQLPQSNAPPPLPPRQSQQFALPPNLVYEMPTPIEQPQAQQQHTYPPPPPLQQRYSMPSPHYYNASPESSQVSFRSSTFSQSTTQGSASHATWENTPRSSQGSDLQNPSVPPPPKQWTSGGYDGEGYG